jgi:AcrR family transcriptional regulator
MQQTKVLVDAAKRLIHQRGSNFTTQELVEEAGVAKQTFYRHFTGKDQLLMAAIEDMMTDQLATLEDAARQLPGPVARLRYYVAAILSDLDAEGAAGAAPRFITAEHWRLHQLYPEELDQATRPFLDLVTRELRAAQDDGALTLADVDHSAEMIVVLVRSMYHHYAFAARKEPADALAERVWQFCLAGIGGINQRAEIRMTDDEVTAFLQESRIATFATLGPAGIPT